MSARTDQAATIHPLLDRAAKRSSAFVAGSGSLEQILLDMENRLEATIMAAEAEVRQIDLDERRRKAEQASETRRHLAALRETLLERATALARRYDSVLELLDDADRALARDMAAAPADAVATR